MDQARGYLGQLSRENFGQDPELTQVNEQSYLTAQFLCPDCMGASDGKEQ